ELPGTFTSTHVHVSAGGLPLYVLKNLLRIWRFLEAPIFRLSCAELGYHRGMVRKEYAYCRPLSSPLVVFDQNGSLRPSFSVPNLLKAETLEDFFLGYGATDPQREPIRYHPARYCAFNLLPLLTLGTVELRTPNETIDPRNIVTWVEIAKALLNAAIGTKGLSDDDYPQLPLGYKGDFDLGMMQTLLELPDSIMANVDRLWNMAGWQDFDGIPLVNSNNDNLSLSWNRLNAPTVPDVINGQSVMMYARAASGRNSEDRVFVFHDMRTYRNATGSNPVSVERGRALVRENFRPDATPDQPIPNEGDRISNQTSSANSTGVTPTREFSDTQLHDLYERIRRANQNTFRVEATTTDSPTLTVSTGTWPVQEEILGRFEPIAVEPPEPEEHDEDEDDLDLDDDDNDEEDN
ncbi:MAG TPA: amidoligase family protein, partial [Candidatus Paceibacterota bacterium]